MNVIGVSKSSTGENYGISNKKSQLPFCCSSLSFWILWGMDSGWQISFIEWSFIMDPFFYFSSSLFVFNHINICMVRWPCHWVDTTFLKKSFNTLCSVVRRIIILKNNFITKPIFYLWNEESVQNLYGHLCIDC